MITVSIVSHGHGEMIKLLINQLLMINEIKLIIITFNLKENIEGFPVSSKIKYIYNKFKRGYGSNHNAAFGLASTDFFCVLNPDIVLLENPFAVLLNTIKTTNAKLVAPLVLSKNGIAEDSMRYSPTLLSLLRKLLIGDKGHFKNINNESIIYPDWVAGMFMLFDSEYFKFVGGFDESYYMYYEDVDICERIWMSGGQIVGDVSCKVIHDARRASRKNFVHMKWHLASMIRYLWRYR